MKTLFYFIATFAVCSASSRFSLVLRALSAYGAAADVDDSGVGSSCTAARECKDCNVAKICISTPSGFTQVASLNCSRNSKTPYCNPENGRCTDVAPKDECTPAAEKFYCPEENGVYPDPLSCTRYHICLNGIDTTIPCARNNVYDHDLGECRLQRLPRDCVTFNCLGREGQEVLYPKDDGIWAVCVGGRAYIEGRCKSYQKYDVGKAACQRVCTKVENQPHETDCDKYVRCSDIGFGVFEAVEYPCPPGLGFDEKTGKCSDAVTCPKKAEDSDDSENDDHESGNLLTRIINNSGSDNSDNSVSNGNDNVVGSLVNGDENGDQTNAGNIVSSPSNNQGAGTCSSCDKGDRIPTLRIINSSGNGNSNNQNNVSNGDDDVDGNVVNGNNQGSNIDSGNSVSISDTPSEVSMIGIEASVDENGDTNSGNDQEEEKVEEGSDGDSAAETGIINSSGSSNSKNQNNISNEDDDIDGNLANGNNEGSNVDSGNSVAISDTPSEVSLTAAEDSADENDNDQDLDNDEKQKVENSTSDNSVVKTRIINSSGNNNSENLNDISNGSDDVDGNLVNGNNAGHNIDLGNLVTEKEVTSLVRIINNSGNQNSNNSVSNGDDGVSGSLVNGNKNGDSLNSGNIA